MQYNEIKLEDGRLHAIEKNINDIIFYIPLDELNSDYQEYLKWLEENNG